MLATQLTVLAMILLQPVRMYFQPGHPVEVSFDRAAILKAADADADAAVKLLLLTPDGKTTAEAALPADAARVDLAAAFPDALWSGKVHYVQTAIGDKQVGSPLVVVPQLTPGDPRQQVNALRIFPEKLVEMTTSEGSILLRLDHAAAPNHAMHFELLVERGFYRNIPMHRILPDFVIQTGDPTGTGSGGPGYQLDLEPSDKQHHPGTLSMARSQARNSAGSQFFICLTREKCQHLDNLYTAFGDVVEGMDVVKKLGATPLADPQAGRPVKAPMLESSRMVPAPPMSHWAQPAADRPSLRESAATD